MTEKANLVFGHDSLGESCLHQYFEAQRKKSALRLPADVALKESESFESDVRNLTDHLDKFLASENRETSYLILGKVQSGKTAHMVGSVSWAADSEIALVATFTGVTGPLNDQTFDRFVKDLPKEKSYVEILRVPTSPNSGQYKVLRETVFNLIRRRATRKPYWDRQDALPVLVTLKNKNRIQTLLTLLDELSAEFGNGICALLIDDEADQASQNAKANKRDSAATYAAISSLRDARLRNIMLSYTATPQAVLLTEKMGRIRPEYCITVKPRLGYFGLADSVSDEFRLNRKEIDDWPRERKVKEIPLSLRSAILEFFWVAWIRIHRPEVFYSGTGLTEDQLAHRMKSTQMLIHESNRVAAHDEMYLVVKGEINSLVDSIFKMVTNDLPKNSRDDLHRLLQESLNEVARRAGTNVKRLLHDGLTNEVISGFTKLLMNNRILIVNGKKDSLTSGDKTPVSDSDWDERETWILIGGDILGRGLTIPQLTTTFFLREAKQPNYDTVYQQMRFCGYRKDYQAFTSIWAPQSIFDVFTFMSQIDSVLWERATIWDHWKENIKDNMPPIFYAAAKGAPLNPTRKSVQDPEIIERKIGETVFSFTDVFSPHRYLANVGFLRTWLLETGYQSSEHKGRECVDEVQIRDLQWLITSWEANVKEALSARSAAELFEIGEENLGLQNCPITLIFDPLLLTIPSTTNGWLEWKEKVSVTRSVSNARESTSLNLWISSITSKNAQSNKWPQLATPHIGDGQRKLKKSMSYESSVLLIEPILGMHFPKNRGSAVAIGAGFTLFAPSSFEIRTFGHK